MSSERFTVDDDTDIYNPKSKAFCRACVDVSAIARLQPGGKAWLAKRAQMECPADKAELGRASWTLLHTMAAYYPENPTPEQQGEMAGFLRGFASFYPCMHCAIDFKTNMMLHPPLLANRESLSGWMCKQHNLVNKKTGKPLFDCSRVLERWRHGWKDGSCDIPGVQ